METQNTAAAASRKDELAIIVNGREGIWGERKISFEQVVKLAFGTIVNSDTTIYTVTYSKGPAENPKGSMVKGNVVKVRDGMVFNVTKTDKS